MSSFKTGLKYWLQIFLIPLYLLSFLCPRDKNTWVFGSSFGRRFADNPKYFYLYLNAMLRQENNTVTIKPIWITKSREIEKKLQVLKLPVYYLYSCKGIIYSMRAKVYFYDNYTKDITFALSGGAVKINLWHGIPLKKINWDNLYDTVRHPRSAWAGWKWKLRRMTDEKPSHYVITTSEFLRPIFSSAFQTDRVVNCGYPRNDLILPIGDQSQAQAACLSQIKEWVKDEELTGMKHRCRTLGCRLILYMPTFRDSEAQLQHKLDFKRLNLFLKENHFFMIFKLHPKSKVQEMLRHIMKTEPMENLGLLSHENDPYPLLLETDILITDYSSIYFDYLLCGRPIIFFDYDRQEYLRRAREFYFDYEAFTPGVKAEGQEELEHAILEAGDTPQKDRCAREALLRRVFDETTGTASERLYELTKKIVCL